jgi:D-inositol-3-phosphate glycosyltransferase
LPMDTFIVGFVGRNQWRKRLDLTVRYFANWIRSEQVNNALLWVHSAPTGDDAWSIGGLAEYYGVVDRVASAVPKSGAYGFPKEMMADVYRTFDCLFTTTLGEGFHLPTFEAMASGVPVIAPEWSALGELGKDAACLVPCSAEAVHPRKSCTTVGGIMDEGMAIDALDKMYSDLAWRADVAAAGLSRASEQRFRWANVGAMFLRHVEEELARG